MAPCHFTAKQADTPGADDGKPNALGIPFHLPLPAANNTSPRTREEVE
jgi:hypothetical protein